MAAVTIYSDFGAQENKICHYFQFFPIFCHEVMGSDVMIFIFECWVLSQSSLLQKRDTPNIDSEPDKSKWLAKGKPGEIPNKCDSDYHNSETHFHIFRCDNIWLFKSPLIKIGFPIATYI